ncbi:MAG: DUF6879 family protein [Pseudonocardiaceae bacterium]
MFDLDVLALDPSRGARLDIGSYRREFRLRRGEIYDSDSWKFERRQHFEEQGSPGRDAFRRGDWEGAMRILEGKRESVLQSVCKDRENRSTFYRVRVVEDPISGYMQWELQSLRMQAECGKPIRVVSARAVSALENTHLLPEVVVLGSKTIYEVVYTDSGVPDYAVRFTNAELAKNWEEFIKELYNIGEDVVSYVDRQVAHLPPPQP